MAIYLKNIDLSNNQLQNAALHPTATQPSGAVEGQIYFDTTALDKQLYYYDGTVWTPVRIADGIGLEIGGTAAAPVFDLDFTATSLSAVTTNTSADIFAMYDDSVGGMRGITFGNLESNLTIANMIGGGAVGTVTSVTAGDGMTQTGTATINPTLNVVSAAGSAGTVGTLVVTTDAVGVSLGTTSTTAAAGNHTHVLAVGATDVTATASEVNLLDLSAQSVTAGEVLIGTGASTAAWQTIASSDLSNSSNIVLNNQANTYTGTTSKQTFIASTTSAASIRLQAGVDPTTPVAGDVWLQSDNLKYRDSTATRTIAYAGGAFHDGFSDHEPNEHINHASVTITLNQTANETSVSGAGQTIDGNVTFTVGIADNPIIPGTGGMIPIAGTTAQRVNRTGNFRYNTTDDIVEWYDGAIWRRPDTGGGEANQDAFSVVTGDSGTATADAVSDTIAITGGTGLSTTATAGASAALSVDFALSEVTNTATTTLDYIILSDQNNSEAVIKRQASSFITDQGIALLASPAFTGNPTAPTPAENDNDTSIATTAFVKLAVDSALNGNDTKESVVAASTADLTGITYNSTGGASNRGQITTAPNTLDGVTLVADDRILLKDQSPGAENGIWVVTTVGTGSNGVWDRATDFDEDDEVTTGAFVYVEEGTENEATGWRLITLNPITIGGASGTALSFAQVSGTGTYIAGDGLDLTGTTFSVNVDNSSLAIVTDTLEIKNDWAGQGSITTVGDLSSGSIAAGFDAIIDARLATITTANKVSGSAVQLSTDSAIENSTGLRLKSSIAGDSLTLTNTGGDQVLDVAAADTTTVGAVELATDTEAETATDSTRAVTPSGLGSYARVFTKTCDAAATTTVTHNLGHRNVTVEVYRTGSPYDTVHCDVARDTVNSVQVTITPTPTAGLYTIVVTGAADAATAAS